MDITGISTVGILGDQAGYPMRDYSNCFVIASSVFLFNFFRKIRLNHGKLHSNILLSFCKNVCLKRWQSKQKKDWQIISASFLKYLPSLLFSYEHFFIFLKNPFCEPPEQKALPEVLICMLRYK